MDRRALPGLFGGLAGCAFGVVGALVGSPIVTVVAAGCALVAAASCLALVERLRHAEQDAAVTNAELATLRNLELTATQRAGFVDAETGLPDGRFFDLALATRISAARRHLWPVSVVLLEFTPGSADLAHAVSAFTTLIRQTLREADTVCRVAPRAFGLVLEDTNEAGGVWAAERVQAAVASDGIVISRVAAGVATYPTHGLSSGDVQSRARAALARAVAADAGHGVGVVEVASLDAVDRRGD